MKRIKRKKHKNWHENDTTQTVQIVQLKPRFPGPLPADERARWTHSLRRSEHLLHKGTFFSILNWGNGDAHRCSVAFSSGKQSHLAISLELLHHLWDTEKASQTTLEPMWPLRGAHAMASWPTLFVHSLILMWLPTLVPASLARKSKQRNQNGY